MIFLNIETETANYHVEFPYDDETATDLWYDIEDLLPSELVDSVIDYKKSKTAKGQEIDLKTELIEINALKEEEEEEEEEEDETEEEEEEEEE